MGKKIRHLVDFSSESGFPYMYERGLGNRKRMRKVLKTIQIISDPDVATGKPYIAGHRVAVDHVAYCETHLGWDVERIATSLNLSTAEVYAALSYYHNNRGEIDALIEEENAPLV